MQKRKSIAPLGLKSSRRESVQRVDSLFNLEGKIRNIVHTNASMTLDDLLDEKCAWCAKPFTTTRTDKKYCSKTCRVAANYEEFHGWRKHAIAALACVDCGAPLPEAKKQDKKLCPVCKRKHRLANCKANRERTKAGANGGRGTNQYAKIEAAAVTPSDTPVKIENATKSLSG